MSQKVIIFGLDCAGPELIFEQFYDDLPNMKKLIQKGIWGKLKSCVPPITVPAWTCMMSSQEPGQLGFYGFRNRANYSYDEMSIANSQAVKAPRVWNLLSRRNKEVILVGVPQTYPPSRVNGCMVTSFLTPSTKSQYTYPNELRYEIEKVVGKYMIDVDNFRTEDKDYLLRQFYEMTEKRFQIFRHFLETRNWDFAMMVEMGIDRIHHAFWKFHDKEHPKYQPGSKWESAIKDYYVYVDQEIGKTLEILDDDTTKLVVSDHGVKKMDGGICINEWLIKNGYLKLFSRPNEITRLQNKMIDFKNTIAWAAGGYYARVFLNVKGREPQGVISREDYEKVRDEIIDKLEAMTDPDGKNIGTRAFKPQEVYKVCRNIPPDLIVYLGDLHWRSIGSVGFDSIYTFENDTGPDDANHAEHGVFIMSNDSLSSKEMENLNIMDIAPTVLALLELPIPPQMEGKPVNGLIED